MIVASAILVPLVLVGLLLRRRCVKDAGRHGLRQWLLSLAALATVLFAVLGTAWIGQLRTSYLSGCVDYVNAAPFGEDQAFSLAPTLAYVALALCVAWLVVDAVLAIRRRAA